MCNKNDTCKAWCGDSVGREGVVSTVVHFPRCSPTTVMPKMPSSQRPPFLETPLHTKFVTIPMAPKKISQIWESARVKGDAEPVGAVTNGFFDAARSPVHQKLIDKFNNMCT